MLKRTLSRNRGIKGRASQGTKELVPSRRRPLTLHARCLFFRRLTVYSVYSSKELQAKNVLETGDIVCSQD